jgi:arylsulfatase A-like enzyme
MSRTCKRLACLGVAFLMAFAIACSDASHSRPRHVLILTVDTLRADYLGSAGYELATTPTLDALYQSATVFDRAVTPVPRTTPALASLLTGRYPPTTGVRRLYDRLAPDATSLAEIARDNGFTTVAVVSNHILGEERGLWRGFDLYDFAGDVRSASETNQALALALKDRSKADRIFAWVHYIDPHVPYLPARETVDALLPAYRGAYRYGFGQKAGGTGDAAYPKELPKRKAVFRNLLSDAVNARIRHLYAADIRDTDSAIESLLSFLREEFGDDWTIVFTSDHGESLGEHDYFFDHGDYVYNATTRVPLAIQLPPDHAHRGARRVEDWVSLVDIAPTLVELLGWEVADDVASRFEGRSLAHHFRDEARPAPAVFAESGKSFHPRMIRGRTRFDVAGRFRAVWKDEWKLIWTPFAADDAAYQLFDLASDPHEREDVSAQHPDKLAELQAELTSWMREADAEIPDVEPTTDDLEALRELGYVE